MASIPVLLSVLFMLFAKESKGESSIKLGSWLSPEGSHSSWTSSSGRFAFGFYPQPQGNGFAVGIWLVSTVTPPQNTIVWTTNRDSPSLASNSTLILINTGLRLFPSGKKGQYLITNFTTITSASMLDSGNFVLYGDTNTVAWQSFDHPTDTILRGQNLSISEKLVSSVSKSDHSSERFFLIMQGDGNLVAYPVNSPATAADAYWSPNWAFNIGILHSND